VRLVKYEGNFAPVSLVPGQTEYISSVVHVHNKYPVESVKIIRMKLPGTLAGNVNTVFSSYMYGALIRQLSGVPVPRSCTVNCPGQTSFCCPRFHNSLSKRTAANIAQTYHQYLHGKMVYHFLLPRLSRVAAKKKAITDKK
jgi:hypothetical protein